MTAMTQAQCLVIGIDNHVGAYLARLLDARGFAKAGGLAGVGDSGLVQRLGIAESLAPLADADAADAATKARLIFAVSDGSAARADMIAQVMAAAGSAARPVRLVHIADMADLALAPVRDTIRRVAATRPRPCVNALLEAHDSRLGRADTLTARIIAAAKAGSNDRLAIAETGPRDWGWTPEYVDAVVRLALGNQLTDIVVASGHRLTAAEIADHAFGYFRRRAADHIEITGAGSEQPPINAAAVTAATGWKAMTTGRDLVHALCEGAGDRA
jgi:GDP-D-mannose dehydratase